MVMIYFLLKSKAMTCCCIVYMAKSDRRQTTAALSNSGTASDQSNNEQERTNSDDDDGWNQCVHILKEMVIVIICDKHIGSNITQDTSSGLQGENTQGQCIKNVLFAMISCQKLETS